MTKLEQIEAYTEAIESALEYKPYSKDINNKWEPDPYKMNAKLERLIEVSTACANAIKLSIELYAEEYTKSVTKMTSNPDDAELMKSLPSLVLKELIKSRVGEFEALKAQCERLDSKVSHGIDGMRTMISYYKEYLNVNT